LHDGVLLVPRTDKKAFLKVKKAFPDAKVAAKARAIIAWQLIFLSRFAARAANAR